MIQKIVLMMVFLFSFTANAGLWIEPYVGYSINAVDLNQEVGGYDLKYAFKDLRYGGRVGFKTLGFMYGVDYNMGSGTMEADIPDAPALITDQLDDMDVSISNLGVYLGYKLPVLFKVWGTYWIDSKYKADGDDDATKGSGYSVGVGFAPIPLPLPLIDLFINVEYKMVNFTEYGSEEIDYDVKEILISASVPISL